MDAKKTRPYVNNKGLAAPEEILSTFQSQKYYFNTKYEVDEANTYNFTASG